MTEVHTTANRLQVLHLLPRMPLHPCAYLPGRIASDRGFTVEHLNPSAWEELLKTGWRRAGMMIYEPACPDCRQCISMRLPVARFRPGRSHRRVLARNADLAVRWADPLATDERADLYRRYITQRHNGMMSGSRSEFERFLCISPVETRELEYRRIADDRLLMVGTVDLLPGGLSCVYCYFDPDEQRRSLGTFNVLTAVDQCRRRCPEGHIYLGYWVEGSATMDYKSRFTPHELLRPDGRWESIGDSAPQTQSAITQ